MKKLSRIAILTILIIVTTYMAFINLKVSYAVDAFDCIVDLTNLKYTANGTETEITNYTQDQFNEFVTAYNTGSLPPIYTTEFLYDGVGMVKTPDLDDFTEAGSNDILQ